MNKSEYFEAMLFLKQFNVRKTPIFYRKIKVFY